MKTHHVMTLPALSILLFLSSVASANDETEGKPAEPASKSARKADAPQNGDETNAAAIAKEDGAAWVERVAKLGPGVHRIKKDSRGRISSCVVVGQARISTALGASKGVQVARDKANLAASAEFVRWLKESVRVHQKSDDELILFTEGSEADGAAAAALTESGKAVEKSSTQMESVAEGLVRGLQLLHADVSKDDKQYTVVKGWKADTAEATRSVGADLKRDEPKGSKRGGAKNGAAAEQRESKRTGDREIKDKEATSDDVKDF